MNLDVCPKNAGGSAFGSGGTGEQYRGFIPMLGEIEKLEHRMRVAAEGMDFELARRLRDQINLIRGGASGDEAAAADTAGLMRQQNGAMGLGTSQSKPTRPAGWIPPEKPDPMTSSRSRKRR